MPVKVTERDGGMASGILRASVRVVLIIFFLAAVSAIVFFVIAKGN
ncbi:MAG: hypothetical protein ACXVBE_10655 [Bdellovibrionota bacterium]